jgi:hypothetical protein
MKTNIEVALYLLSISPNDAERNCGERAEKEYDKLIDFVNGMLDLVAEWHDTGYIDDIKVNDIVAKYRE